MSCFYRCAISDEKVFMMESHRKKMLKNEIAHLEADLEVQ